MYFKLRLRVPIILAGTPPYMAYSSVVVFVRTPPDASTHPFLTATLGNIVDREAIQTYSSIKTPPLLSSVENDSLFILCCAVQIFTSRPKHTLSPIVTPYRPSITQLFPIVALPIFIFQGLLNSPHNNCFLLHLHAKYKPIE